VADLLGCDTAVAVRRVKVAEQVVGRRALDGQVCAPRLPTTAMAFATGEASLRHVEVITEALGTPAAERLAPHDWAGVEEQLAEHATSYRPRELAGFARELIDILDQDGAEPDDRDFPQLNELHLSRNVAGVGGRIKGTLDAATFDALSTALGALSHPTAVDLRSVGERNADALGEICHRALDDAQLPSVGGERPHLTVTVSLGELEGRGRGATLDTGPLSPSELRRLACDARVVPVVLGGNGQPLDIGRAMRTVPAHLRRAVVTRDRGCAFAGCGREPGWCEVHHIVPWEHGGPTEIGNLVMLCRFHHRLVHHSGWTVRIRDGQPEFIPPKWIDIQQIPRRRPPRTPRLTGARPLAAVGG
jgi:5-methylcytosine-specific restriction protein A